MLAVQKTESVSESAVLEDAKFPETSRWLPIEVARLAERCRHQTIAQGVAIVGTADTSNHMARVDRTTSNRAKWIYHPSSRCTKGYQLFSCAMNRKIPFILRDLILLPFTSHTRIIKRRKLVILHMTFYEIVVCITFLCKVIIYNRPTVYYIIMRHRRLQNIHWFLLINYAHFWLDCIKTTENIFS